jgi:hypothetical protein
MKKLLLVAISLFCASAGAAQSKQFSIPLGASAAWEEQEDWDPAIEVMEGEVKDEHHSNRELSRAKQQLLNRMQASGTKTRASARDVLDTPFVWKSFQGNATTSGVPNDNDIAVSTTGFLISVCNTNIFKFDLNGDSSLGTTSLTSFCTSLGNFYSKYDPKVIYDPDQNKFVVVFLAGFTHSTSSIIVAFSESDHPNGIWNFYELPGNPLDDTLWSDFPMIALTNQELFITVNHLVDDETWQEGWRRTVIWQVNKFDGFNGDTLRTQLHYDIKHNGKGVRNLCPVKGGSHLYGSDIYFLSQRNLDVQNDTFFVVHLTDTINAPAQELTVQALTSPAPYFVPVNAIQPHVTELATNDSRVLGAFYENDQLQFVGNTTDTATGTSAIYHGVISNVSTSPTISFQMISDDTLCYGYPNIAYAGSGANDHTAIIIVLRSAVDVYPGYASFITDGMGSYSSLIDIKEGLSYHYYLNGTQRWGDYTGAQRDYNNSGTVWVNGSFATENHKVSTWLAQLGLLPPPALVPQPVSPGEMIGVYPNPFNDRMAVRFALPSRQYCTFGIYDSNGRFIAKLLEDELRPGENSFSFSVHPLAAGEYFLKITSEEKVIAVQKVVKQ